MPYIPRNRNTNNARFPTPPQKSIRLNAFPNDLIDDSRGGRNFYTQITFVDYITGAKNPGAGVQAGLSLLAAGIEGVGNLISNLFSVAGNVAGYTAQSAIGPIILPIPKKINDAVTLTWQEESLTKKASEKIPAIGAAAEAIATTSFMTGLTVNPFLFMFFQRPNFKEFVFQWTLIPYNEKESTTIVNIVNAFKKAALPTKTSGFLLQYPMIANISFSPNEFGRNMIIKPCAIISVQVDYTGAGMPSFFKGTNLPTIVNLSLSLKEIQLWDSSEISA